MNEDGEYVNDEFVKEFIEQIAENPYRTIERNKLIRDCKELVAENDALRGKQRPVGRPIAASPSQQAQVILYRQEGWSLRRIVGHLLAPLPPDMRDDTAFMDRLHAYAQSSSMAQPAMAGSFCVQLAQRRMHGLRHILDQSARRYRSLWIAKIA